MFINNSLFLLLPPGGPDLHTYISNNPSALISTTLTPVLHIPELSNPDGLVISSNLKFPLFRYSLFETKFPVKNKSGRESLLKSPMPTPPPL